MLSQTAAIARAILGRQRPETGFQTTEAPRKVMLSAKFLARGLGGTIAVFPLERSWGLIAPWQRHEISGSFQQLLSCTHEVYFGTSPPDYDFRAVHHAGMKTQIISICAVVAEIASRTGQAASPGVTADQAAQLCSKLLSCLAALEPLFRHSDESELPGEVAIDLDNSLSDIARYFA